MTTNYESKPIEKWTVRDFHTYMQAEHLRRFGVSYAPWRSWRTEQGLLGTLIGTQRKAGKYEKAVMRKFIDRCFGGYRPTAQYPGISFGFMWTYMQREMQAVEAEAVREQRAEEQAEDYEGVAEWL